VIWLWLVAVAVLGSAHPLGVQVSVPNVESAQQAVFDGLDKLDRLGAYVVGEDGERLGRLSRGSGSDCLGNEFGAGSEHRSNSPFNPFGKYGSPFRSTSAFNDMASDPPKILVEKDGDVYTVGLLTTNRLARTRGQRINPYIVRAWLKAK